MSTEGLLFTGNALLVVQPGQVLAWLLTEEGLTNYPFHWGMGEANESWSLSFEVPNPSDNSLAISQLRPEARIELHIEGEIRVTEHETIGLFPYRYNTCPGPGIARVSGPGYELRGGFCGRHYLQYHNVHNRNTLPEGGWYPSDTSLQEGWVKDPEGRHRLWLPVEWRKSWDLVDWCHNIITQFSIIKGRTVVVKF